MFGVSHRKSIHGLRFHQISFILEKIIQWVKIYFRPMHDFNYRGREKVPFPQRPLFPCASAFLFAQRALLSLAFYREKSPAHLRKGHTLVCTHPPPLRFERILDCFHQIGGKKKLYWNDIKDRFLGIRQASWVMVHSFFGVRVTRYLCGEKWNWVQCGSEEWDGEVMRFLGIKVFHRRNWSVTTKVEDK